MDRETLLGLVKRIGDATEHIAIYMANPPFTSIEVDHSPTCPICQKMLQLAKAEVRVEVKES